MPAFGQDTEPGPPTFHLTTYFHKIALHLRSGQFPRGFPIKILYASFFFTTELHIQLIVSC